MSLVISYKVTYVTEVVINFSLVLSFRRNTMANLLIRMQ